MGVVPFVVAVRKPELRRLNKLAQAKVEQEKKWLEKRRKGHTGLRAGELAQARKELRAQLAAEREAGRLLGSRDLVLARALRAELTARGWLKEWPAPEPGGIGPGRRWGADPGRYGHDLEEDGGFKARLAVRLPEDLGETLRRACYWHCHAIEKQLQEWADRWGDGPEVILRRAERENGGGIPLMAFVGAALGKRAPLEALKERDKLRAQIITTGDVLRAAVDRAIGPAPAPVQTEIPLP